jgi:1,4-dihydroxy-2-naphthoate octaprenyltransferase
LPDEGGAALFIRATRAKVLPVMLAPVAVGGALAWAKTGFFTWGWFVVTVVGASAMHLGANVINDYFDETSGADQAARRDPASFPTGSGVIATGQMTRRATLALAGALFGVALACGLALAIARGPWVIGLGAIGFFLAVGYVAPPLAYGYIGRGLGELGIFVAFGFLPVVGSYYVQTLRIDSTAVWASVVPGLFTTLVLYHHHFLHWRADREAGKMTPVAVLGPERALVFSAIALVAIYVILIVQVAVDLWPAWALFALVTALPLGAALARMRREHDEFPAVFQLLGSTLGASVLTGAVLTLSLVGEAAGR